MALKPQRPEVNIGQAEGRRLADILTEFGLEVPYQQDLGKEHESKLDDAENNNQVGDGTCTSGKIGRRGRRVQSSSLKLKHPISEDDIVWKKENPGIFVLPWSHQTDKKNSKKEKEKFKSWRKLGSRVSSRMVRSLEATTPVRAVKQALSVISFRREDNIKHELDLGTQTSSEDDLSYEHFKRLEDAFVLHDGGGKGYLSKTQLRSCLRTLGHNPTEQEVWRFMAQVDVDHSGTLDFEEFFDLMSSMMCGWQPEVDLGVCWRAIDTKGRNCVQVRDARYLLSKFGAKMQDPELDQLLDGLRPEDSLNYATFVEAVVGPRPPPENDIVDN